MQTKNLHLAHRHQATSLKHYPPPTKTNSYPDIDPLEDLNTELERKLGGLVKERYGTDYYVLYRFPAKVRPGGVGWVGEGGRLRSFFCLWPRARPQKNYATICHLESLGTTSNESPPPTFKPTPPQTPTKP
jgi:hypothetical protein